MHARYSQLARAGNLIDEIAEMLVNFYRKPEFRSFFFSAMSANKYARCLHYAARTSDNPIEGMSSKEAR